MVWNALMMQKSSAFLGRVVSGWPVAVRRVEMPCPGNSSRIRAFLPDLRVSCAVVNCYVATRSSLVDPRAHQ